MNDKTNKVLVNVILDRSGSMGSIVDGTISGFNEYLKGLRSDKDTEYSISLLQFDHTATDPQLTICYIDKPLAEVPDLDNQSYQPRGGTPLYDAIGECVRRVEAKDRAVICVVITDGQENASHEFTKDTIRAVIKDKESAGWAFVFLGCNIDSFADAGAIGVAAMNVSNYAPSNAGMKAAMGQLTNSTRTRSEGYRVSGIRASNRVEMFTSEQRNYMMNPEDATTSGGRPAVPPKFQTTTNPSAASTSTASATATGKAPVERKPRAWKSSTEDPSVPVA